jgi:hypothetical protein
MLELRPNCEYCDKDLPPDSTEACICSYECTFCSSCVENLLRNVCPNCGGGFTLRPVRPKIAHRNNVSIINQPASSKRVITKLNRKEIEDFCNGIKSIPPEVR